MAVTKEQIQRIISENNISSVADVYTFPKDSFKDILSLTASANKTRKFWIRMCLMI